MKHLLVYLTLLLKYVSLSLATDLWQARHAAAIADFEHDYDEMYFAAERAFTKIIAHPNDNVSDVNHVIPIRAKYKIPTLSTGTTHARVDFDACSVLDGIPVSGTVVLVDVFAYEDTASSTSLFELRTPLVVPATSKLLSWANNPNFGDNATLTCCSTVLNLHESCSRQSDERRLMPAAGGRFFTAWSSYHRLDSLSTAPMSYAMSVYIDLRALHSSYLDGVVYPYVSVRLTSACGTMPRTSCLANVTAFFEQTSFTEQTAAKVEWIESTTPGVRLSSVIEDVNVLPELSDKLENVHEDSYPNDLSLDFAGNLEEWSARGFEVWVMPSAECVQNVYFDDVVGLYGHNLQSDIVLCTPVGPFYTFSRVQVYSDLVQLELDWLRVGASSDSELGTRRLLFFSVDRVVPGHLFTGRLTSGDSNLMLPGITLHNSELQTILNVGNDIDAIVAYLEVPAGWRVPIARVDLWLTDNVDGGRLYVDVSDNLFLLQQLRADAFDLPAEALVVSGGYLTYHSHGDEQTDFTAVRSARVFPESENGTVFSTVIRMAFGVETPLKGDGIDLLVGVESYRVLAVAWPQGRVIELEYVVFVTNDFDVTGGWALLFLLAVVGFALIGVCVRECCDKVGVDDRPRCPGDLVVAVLCIPVCVSMPFIWCYGLLMRFLKRLFGSCRKPGGDARRDIVSSGDDDAERERLRALPYMQPLRAYERWCLRETRHLASIETGKRSILSKFVLRPISFATLLLFQLILSFVQAFFNIVFFANALELFGGATTSTLLGYFPQVDFFESLVTSLRDLASSTSPGATCPFVTYTYVILTLFASLLSSYVLVERNGLLRLFLLMDSWQQAAPRGLRKQIVSVLALFLRAVGLYAMQMFFVATQSFYKVLWTGDGLVRDQCKIVAVEVTDEAVNSGMLDVWRLPSAGIDMDEVLMFFLIVCISTMFVMQGFRLSGKTRVFRFKVATNSLSAADVSVYRRLLLVLRNFAYYLTMGIVEVLFMALRLLCISFGVWPSWLIKSLELAERADTQLRVGIVLGKDEQYKNKKRSVWATDYEWQQEVAKGGNVDGVEMPKPNIDTVLSTVGQAHSVIWLLLPFGVVLTKLGEFANRETPFISGEYSDRVEMPFAYRLAVYVCNLVLFGLTIYVALSPIVFALYALFVLVVVLFALDLVRQCHCITVYAKQPALPPSVRRQTVTARRRRTRHDSGQVSMRSRSNSQAQMRSISRQATRQGSRQASSRHIGRQSYRSADAHSAERSNVASRRSVSRTASMNRMDRGAAQPPVPARARQPSPPLVALAMKDARPPPPLSTWQSRGADPYYASSSSPPPPPPSASQMYAPAYSAPPAPAYSVPPQAYMPPPPPPSAHGYGRN